jgi:hypothetical protein
LCRAKVICKDQLPSTAVFVPPLSLETYQQEAAALFGTVKSYEQEYARFQDINSDLADRQAAVRLMIQQNNATIDAHHQLITQAQNLLSQAQEQAEQAKQKCEDQQYQTKLAKIEFERGLEEWQAEQKWNAMRRMFLAIGDFAISVGTAAATGGGSAAEAIASGLDALKAMLELVGETDALYKEMARALESMQHLEGLVQELENLMQSLLTLTSTDPDAIIEFPDFSLPNLDHISGQTEWDVFLAATDIYLQQALDKNIGGAMAYKLESTKLGIYGKAFLASQAAVVKAAQELWQLLVQAQISQSQQQPLEDYLNELEEREELHTALLQLLFQQQLNQKCWIFLALQNLIWAYQYETIIDRLEVPPITASALELEQALADVVVRLNRILEELNPPPQTADPRQFIEEIEAEHSNYDGVVETFKQHKEVTINIPLHDFSFRGLDRVRVKRWRCVLQGVPVPKGRRISLSLESSGIHTDRWQHEAYQFVARPSIRRFVYEEWHSGANKTIVDDVLGVEHAIFVDGEVAEEYKSHYARPTSFTQWTLRLDDTEGIVDLSTLQSLKLLWQVEAVITHPTAAQT